MQGILEASSWSSRGVPWWKDFEQVIILCRRILDELKIMIMFVWDVRMRVITKVLTSTSAECCLSAGHSLCFFAIQLAFFTAVTAEEEPLVKLCK